MRISLLVLLLLPLHVFAQYRPIYSSPRPSYTPAPVRPGPSPYQVQQQNQQQAHQNFQRMQAQQTQQQMLFRSQQQYRNPQQVQMQQMLLRQRSPEQLAKDQALQQQAEQKATEQLAQLAQEQQRKRLEHPAADAQQASAQQQEDAKQLNQLTVKTYREVFLPGQMTAALQTLTLSAKAQQNLQSINKDLLDNGWWSQQEAAQVKGKIAAYGSALAGLTGDMLGFDIASVPPLPAASVTVGSLDEMLAKDAFDPLAAAQLVREAALAEKIIAGGRLAKAVGAFKNLGNNAAGPELAADPKKLRNEVKASLRKVNKEMQRYNARVGTSGSLYNVQKALLKSTSTYLAKNGK